MLAIQLDDAPRQPEDNLIDATLHARQLPGEGELDLAGYLGALRAIGVRCPVGAEVFSDSLHARGARVAALAAAHATRAVLAASAWPAA